MNLRSVVELRRKLHGKRVIVRVDFNVPMRNMGEILDDFRIRRALPTIEFLLKNRARVIILSHLSRPSLQTRSKFRLDDVSQRLSELLGRRVLYIPDVVGKKAMKAVQALQDSEILVLENLRFYRGETKNDSDFAKKLASFGDYYVNEAFSNCHRKHASMVGIPKYLPSFAGMDLLQEVKLVEKMLVKPKKPSLAIVGGAKISSKLPVLKKLIKRFDAVIVGGGIANTLLLASGKKTGRSLVETKMVDSLRALVKNKKLLLPFDYVCAREIHKKSKAKICNADSLDKYDRIVDIGPETIRLYLELISQAKMIVWAGPMGVYEIQQFSAGSEMIAQAVAESKEFTLVGGGDTIDCIDRFSDKKNFTHVSTGGSALLEFIAKEKLVALRPLMKKSI